jgi:hypothetical protein
MLNALKNIGNKSAVKYFLVTGYTFILSQHQILTLLCRIQTVSTAATLKINSLTSTAFLCRHSTTSDMNGFLLCLLKVPHKVVPAANKAGIDAAVLYSCDN